MQFQPYPEQLSDWPKAGKHILAQFDAENIVVYQAYCPEIADCALAKQRFGGKFSYSRMSWIKPNFLWMMYRSGWASKSGQERILAITLKRTFFEELLRTAVVSSFDESVFATEEEWKLALQNSDVRLQWDPDHDPSGNKCERRAVQLGIRGNMLLRYGQEEIVSIEDITPFVVEQRENNLKAGFETLVTPREEVFLPSFLQVPGPGRVTLQSL